MRHITHISHTQFSFVQKVITDGEFKTVMLPNLGKFMVKQHRRALLEANKERGKDNTTKTE